MRQEWEARDRRIAAGAGAAIAGPGDSNGAAPAGGAGGQPRVGRARRRNAPRAEDDDSSDPSGSSGEEDADEDDDAARAARPLRGRLTVCDPPIQRAIEDFTQSEEQLDIENMSQGALKREVVRIRKKQKVARTALKESVDNRTAGTLRSSPANRAKDVYMLEGGVTATRRTRSRRRVPAEHKRRTGDCGS